MTSSKSLKQVFLEEREKVLRLIHVEMLSTKIGRSWKNNTHEKDPEYQKHPQEVNLLSCLHLFYIGKIIMHPSKSRIVIGLACEHIYSL